MSPVDTSPDVWNPELYERFKVERARAYYDLRSLLKMASGMRVLDLGCGTGNLTRRLHDFLGARETIGLDRSDAMLRRSEELSTKGLSFQRGDVEDLPVDGDFDLVFSNAALHWVDGHDELLGRLAGLLRPGGQLAVQVPDNEEAPCHAVAAEVAAESPFAEALGGWARRSPVLSLTEYARRLHELGFTEQHVRAQIYDHLLPTRDAVVEWVAGTTLTAYAARLPDDLGTAFVRRYAERLSEVLPDERPFFFPFRRILFWGRK